jgi:hypothetical protein
MYSCRRVINDLLDAEHTILFLYLIWIKFMFTSVKGSSMTSRRQINLKFDIFSETIVLAARWGMTPRVCYPEPVIIDDAMTLWHANTQNTASLIPFTHLRPHSRISGLIHAHQTNSLGCSAPSSTWPHLWWLPPTKSKTLYLSIFHHCLNMHRIVDCWARRREKRR